MVKFDPQAVMARSNATKPSRFFLRRHWIASLSLATTIGSLSPFLPPFRGRVRVGVNLKVGVIVGTGNVTPSRLASKRADLPLSGGGGLNQTSARLRDKA
jgi:hypothetical protein